MKKWWEFAIAVIIIGLLIWFLRDINFQEVYSLLKSANLFWVFLAVVCSLGTFIFRGLKLAYILKPFFRVNFFFLMNVLFVTSFFNTITPLAGSVGEIVKTYLLSKKYKKSAGQTFGYILGASFFYLIVIIALLLFPILFIIFFLKIPGLFQLITNSVIVVAIIIVLIGLVFLIGKTNLRKSKLLKNFHSFEFIKKKFATPSHFSSHCHVKVKGFFETFKEVITKKNNWTVGIFLSLALMIFTFLISYFLFRAFDSPVSFLSVVVVVTIGTLMGSLSIMPGGIGIVEGSMTLLYSAMGVEPSLALLVAFLSRIIYYFFALAIGGLGIIHLKIHFDLSKKKK